MWRNSDDWPDHVDDHDRRHVDDNTQCHIRHEREDDGCVVPMTTRVTRVNSGGMPPTGRPGGGNGACADNKWPVGTMHDLSGTLRIDPRIGQKLPMRRP